LPVFFYEAKTFYLKGGDIVLAITKERKKDLIEHYTQWMNQSKAFVVTEYLGLSMKEIDDLRSKVREAGGEFHVVKNTLGKLAFDNAGLPYGEDTFSGSTAFGFAFEDAPALARMMTDFAKSSEFLKIKAGYLGKQPLTPGEVKSLADLPPLPVMRGKLLGVIMAPASKLASVLAEPGRQVAAVIKAYADAGSTPASAA
jgi:large subunit ribosomal protein L10